MLGTTPRDASLRTLLRARSATAAIQWRTPKAFPRTSSSGSKTCGGTRRIWRASALMHVRRRSRTSPPRGSGRGLNRSQPQRRRPRCGGLRVSASPRRFIRTRRRCRSRVVVRPIPFRRAHTKGPMSLWRMLMRRRTRRRRRHVRPRRSPRVRHPRRIRRAASSSTCPPS